MLIDVTSVKILPEYMLELQFANGETRFFDMKPLLHKKPWDKLNNMRIFEKARVDYGTVVFPFNIDIAPETLYIQSTPSPTDREGIYEV